MEREKLYESVLCQGGCVSNRRVCINESGIPINLYTEHPIIIARSIMAPILASSLARLSRESVIKLALLWLDNPATCSPYLASNRTTAESDEEDYLFVPAASLSELRSIYHGFQQDEDCATKSQIVDRILDGDWRRGLTLHQHATLDFAHLSSHDTALKWSALSLVPLDTPDSNAALGVPPLKKRKIQHVQAAYPTLCPTTFLAALKSHICPLVKAHYYLHNLPGYSLPIVRLYIMPQSAFAPSGSSIPSSSRHATDGGRVMYIALPPSCPYIYVSLTATSPSTVGRTSGKSQAKVDIASLKRLVLEAIPKALSRPHERWALASTRLTTRSLKAVCGLRGNRRIATSGGGFARFSASVMAKNGWEASPVDLCAPYPSPPPESNEAVHGVDGGTANADRELEDVAVKIEHKRKLDTRFGPPSTDRAVLDRAHVSIKDIARLRGQDRSFVDAAAVSITFSGTDVFDGIRSLAALLNQTGTSKCIDLAKMPGWMAGEEAKSSFSV